MVPVTASVALVRSPLAAAYDFGTGHPMRAARAELAIELAEALGVLQRPTWRQVEAEPADDEQLRLVHDEVYIDVVRSVDRAPAWVLANYGLGTEDTPVFEGIHEAASAVVGGTLAACQEVWSGRSVHAVSLVGGLHHAMRDAASGFCVYNDAAIGIAELLRAGCARVAYVDLDAHHGDGVEAAFASDPRVLTISLHQDGRTIFPGTGASSDIGHVGAEGYAVNVPLPLGTDDSGWIRAFSGLVPVLVREFAPDVIVTQCGCDAHRNDPLTDLRVSVEGFATAYRLMHELAHEVCDGRWVVVGGGGYDLVSAVPRTWACLLAEISGEPLPADVMLPESWRDVAARIGGRAAPSRVGDLDRSPVWQPWDAGDGDPDDLLDRSVAATRHAVLPLHGLDPFYDR
jgi:acetoin utilization protein AcuC